VALIEVDRVSKSFGSRTALDGISFAAERGEVLGLLGPNGAGKTTTMRILASLTAPSSGRARIAGFDTVRDSRAARARIGYVPERVPLYDEMRVVSFLEFAAAMKGIPRGRAAGAVARVVEEAGLADVRRDPIARLSRGFRQRVGLAQALLGDPAVLLLDEPTAGLDPRQIAETRALIRRAGAERTVLLSTHILSEASAACGRVVILASGRVVAEGAPAALASGRSLEAAFLDLVGGAEAGG
jgi:ABC-2 type transport system ATP-binding protein